MTSKIRRVNGQEYVGWLMHPSADRMRTYRFSKIRCRRFGTELFVHLDDVEEARKLDAQAEERRKTVVPRKRAFDDLTDAPCEVCRELALAGQIPAEAVMPLPHSPTPLHRITGRPCCRDCQATETTQVAMDGQHPEFASARLTIANERLEGLRLPRGVMEHCGLCAGGFLAPCSMDDLDAHQRWLARHRLVMFQAEE